MAASDRRPSWLVMALSDVISKLIACFDQKIWWKTKLFFYILRLPVDICIPFLIICIIK